MNFRLPYAALALALTITACESDAPTSTNTVPSGQAESPALARTPRTDNVLSNIPVTGTQGFAGTLTITRFALDRARGDLLVSGVVRDASGDLASRFTNAVAVFQDGVCPILTLDIGAIHLDVLGLVIDLAPINLDITAESGLAISLGTCSVASSACSTTSQVPCSRSSAA